MKYLKLVIWTLLFVLLQLKGFSQQHIEGDNSIRKTDSTVTSDGFLKGTDDIPPIAGRHRGKIIQKSKVGGLEALLANYDGKIKILQNPSNYGGYYKPGEKIKFKNQRITWNLKKGDEVCFDISEIIEKTPPQVPNSGDRANSITKYSSSAPCN